MVLRCQRRHRTPTSQRPRINFAYHYRNTPHERFLFDSNRFNGDLVDGRLDRLNPYYGAITTFTNLGKRRYHGLLSGPRSGVSQGWQMNASYGYNNSVD